MKSRRFIMFVSAAFVGAVVLVTLLMFSRPPKPEIEVVESSKVELQHRMAPIPATEEDMEEPVVPERRVTIDELIQTCSDPFYSEFKTVQVSKATTVIEPKDALSEQCVALLESYFIDLPHVPDDGYGWIDIPNRMSNRRIFQNPKEDRDLVFKALMRQECQFGDGRTIRPNLLDTCHSDSFYAYGTFIQICDNPRYQTDIKPLASEGKTYRTPEEWDKFLREQSLDTNGYFNLTQYTRLKRDLWHTELASRWYNRKCIGYDMETLGFDANNPDSTHFDAFWKVANLSGYPIFLANHPELIEEIKETYSSPTFALIRAEILKVLAAHYGNYSASLLYSQREIKLVALDSILAEANRAKHPWMEYLVRARNLADYGKEDIRGTQSDFNSLVDRSIRGLLALDEAEFGYDFMALVDTLCRNVIEYWRNEEEIALSCQTAIEELNFEENLSFQYGKKLDEIEQIARELGIWR